MAPKAEYTAVWQLHCGEIKQRGAQILKSEFWSDCSFLVVKKRDKDIDIFEDAEVLKAHKLILAMASPVFEAMFYGPIAESGKPIPIPDIDSDTFKGLLEYIYTDNIELDSFNSACNLYYAAQKYMLPHLLTVCTTYLSCNLTPEIACQMYEFVQLVDEKSLIEECEKMIKSDTPTILKSKGFEEISLDTVEKIFAMEKLNISDELELFEAAERYARALDIRESTSMNCFHAGLGKMALCKESPKIEKLTDNDNAEEKKHCLDSTSKEEYKEKGSFPQYTRTKKAIKRLVQHIRFLTLTPKQLAEYPKLSSLLMESEILALMMNTASTKTHMPMPLGFSTERTSRL